MPSSSVLRNTWVHVLGGTTLSRDRSLLSGVKLYRDRILPPNLVPALAKPSIFEYPIVRDLSEKPWQRRISRWAIQKSWAILTCCVIHVFFLPYGLRGTQRSAHTEHDTSPQISLVHHRCFMITVSLLQSVALAYVQKNSIQIVVEKKENDTRSQKFRGKRATVAPIRVEKGFTLIAFYLKKERGGGLYLRGSCVLFEGTRKASRPEAKKFLLFFCVCSVSLSWKIGAAKKRCANKKKQANQWLNYSEIKGSTGELQNETNNSSLGDPLEKEEKKNNRKNITSLLRTLLLRMIWKMMGNDVCHNWWWNDDDM